MQMQEPIPPFGEAEELPKVLIVDDDARNQFAMLHVLEDKECEPFTASSGVEALEKLALHEFAVALLDVQMPGMDGFQLAAAMKEDERTSHIPIIFLTAISKEDEHILKGYEVGAVDYLFKPINTTVLESKVETFLDLYRQKKKLDVMEEFRRASDDLDQFTEIASREFATLLGTVSENTEALNAQFASGLDDTGRAHLGAAMDAASSLRGMLISALRYIRLGTRSAPPLPVSLKGVLERELGRQELDELGKKVRIEVGEMPMIAGDSVDLGKLFRHLVNLSATLADPAMPVVKILAEEVAGEWQVMVWANGAVSLPEAPDALFRIAAAPEDGASRSDERFKLATCRKIVDLHGGQLALESPPGGGVAFRMNFPKLRGTQLCAPTHRAVLDA